MAATGFSARIYRMSNSAVHDWIITACSETEMARVVRSAAAADALGGQLKLTTIWTL